MSRSQKIQEMIIQLLVLWFAFSNLATVALRPMINRGLAVVALVVILSGLVLHVLNFYSNEKYFKTTTLSHTKKLWIFFVVSTALIVFCFVFGTLGLLYFSPLILLYPVHYFYRHQWFPRAILLLGLICATYSQMHLTKNDRLHALVNWMAKHPERFNHEVIRLFDRKNLTAIQAYDVATLLTLHPDESLRDYKGGHEFAQIALRKKPNPHLSKKIAYTLACAMIGEKKIENARSLASQYKLNGIDEVLTSQSVCEPLPSRQPASRQPTSIQRKKYKYYF